MANKQIKTAVIGVGHLGGFHVRQLKELPEANLVGIFDTDAERLAAVSAEQGVSAFNSFEEAVSAAEAVSVVVPTARHFEVASRALDAGCHVFIEKPITSTLEEADKLLRLAEKCERLVQVGHIERLNPALTVLDKYDLQPRFIEGHRLASFTDRGTDVPVILDLMIHDIDVVLHLIRSPIRDIHANGVQVITDSADIATARLEFENGAVANLTASRISQRQMRKLRIFQASMYIGIDFLQRITEVYRLSDSDPKNDEGLVTLPFEHAGRRRLITYEKPATEKYDALYLELRNFIRSVAGVEKPAVDGYDARAALDVAIQVQAAVDSSSEVLS